MRQLNRSLCWLREQKSLNYLVRRLLSYDMYCIYIYMMYVVLLADYLTSSGHQGDEHSLVSGYILGYLCILTGHRSIAMTNMTKESVAGCVSWNRGKLYQVLVSILHHSCAQLKPTYPQQNVNFLPMISPGGGAQDLSIIWSSCLHP